MRIVGVYHGYELNKIPGTDTYQYRVPVDTDGAGSTHDVHARVRLGSYGSLAEAFAELTRKVDLIERSEGRDI